MADKELSKLTRRELLEILIEQGKELERVRHELNAATEQLNKREIALANCGSIAEASLKLNGVFEAAQAAANQYLESVKAASADPRQARATAEEIIRSAEEERIALLEETRRECAAMIAKAKDECLYARYDVLRREMN